MTAPSARRRRRRPTKPLEGWLSWAFLKAAGAGFRLLPYSLLHVPGEALGVLAYRTMPRYRRVARANLRRAFPEWDAARIEAVARTCFRHLGITLAEFLWFPRLRPGGQAAMLRRVMRVTGQEHLDAALAEGNGAILVSAHYGNWEMAAAGMVDAGYTVHTIIREAEFPALNRAIDELRAHTGERTLPRQHATRPALACLRRNEVLAILLDQNTRKGAIFVDFFGTPAATAAGPATLSRRTGAPLVPLFSVRQPDRSHVVHLLPPIRPDRDAAPEEEIRRLTAAVTRVIEEQVRACPEQWLWIHNRWKTRPDSTQWRPDRDGDAREAGAG